MLLDLYTYTTVGLLSNLSSAPIPVYKKFANTMLLPYANEKWHKEDLTALESKRLFQKYLPIQLAYTPVGKPIALTTGNDAAKKTPSV